ncbi:hypothetical protein DYB31_001454 [Aphanomyces astaci]|uniref:SAC domain-containing protein n=1 Tax=Aphanomyces astaci TaxID=112090 RepID=A0A397F530_APHAT|nr:hypothetical protein DYB31_001454 [Aphanomyces astaci]
MASADKQVISGWLLRRTTMGFFQVKGTGDWSRVWCEFDVLAGLFAVYLDGEKHRRLLNWKIQVCTINHVRNDGRFCIELEYGQQRKKETFASTSKSYDIEWWFDVLASSKLALAEGRVPNPPLLVRTPGVVTHVPVGKKDKVKATPKPLRRRQPKLSASIQRFERFTVYETRTHFYLVGSDRLYSQFRMFTLDRTVKDPANLAAIFTDEPAVLGWDAMEATLQELDFDARKSSASAPSTPVGLVRAFSAVAIVGFVKFLQGYYLVLATQRRKIGCIGGHYIYAIQSVQYLAIRQPAATDGTPWTWVNRWFNPDAVEDAEDRYSVLFKLVDLTKDFYYSPTYDLTHTLQHNMTTNQTKPFNMYEVVVPIEFEWNHFLTDEFHACLSSPTARDDWVQPLVMGFYEQRKCSLFGRLISIIVLARRSRHFAGTRFLKRGVCASNVSDTGKVANDVETEQIIEDESTQGKLSSFVQYRGSIPIFWTQESSVTVPKPPIKLNRIDPSYTATQMHFADLFERYGSPILVLNLVKQQEKTAREKLLGQEFKDAIEYLNTFLPPEHRIRYVALDYSRLSKFKVDHSKVEAVRQGLEKVGAWALDQTGFFCSAPKRQIGTGTNKRTARRTTIPILSTVSKALGGGGPTPPRPTTPPLQALKPLSPTIPRDSGDWLEQHGVLRTNCIDCLDRTNVAQFSVAMLVSIALGQQLYAMGIRNTPVLESSSQILQELTTMFGHMGDVISMQYGGSEAHKNVTKSKENIKAWELLTSIRRYYSNAFTDNLKQDAINLFLGIYVPSPSTSPLWLLESDYYLHNVKIQRGLALSEMGPFHRRTNLKQQRSADDKRLALYHRDALQPQWWKPSIEAFDAPKFIDRQGGGGGAVKPTPRTSSSSSSVDHHRKASTASIGSMDDSILQATDKDELFFFDKALGHTFMIPVYIVAKDASSDGGHVQHLHHHAMAPPAAASLVRSQSSLMAQKVRAMSAPDEGGGGGAASSTDVTMKRSLSNVGLKDLDVGKVEGSTHNNTNSSHTGEQPSLNIEEYAAARGIRKEYIGTCTHTTTPDAAYVGYVESKGNLAFWEKDNKSVRSDFVVYLREFSIDADDVDGIHDAAVRGGCTYKIQTGVYAGLDQHTKARALLPTKKFVLKTSDMLLADDRKDDESMWNRPVDPATADLYASYFDQTVNMAWHPAEHGVVGDESITTDTMQSSQLDQTTTATGQYDDYILFNASAADHQFGDVMKTVNELSFVKKN